MTKPTPAESVEGAQSLKNTAIPDQAVVRNSDGTAERGGLERIVFHTRFIRSDTRGAIRV